MKSRVNALRVAEFQMRDKKRQLAQLDMMVAEFERMATELNQQIEAEERRSGITDPDHFAYPTFAKAARQRRDNLKVSMKDLADQRAAAEEAVATASAEYERAMALETREGRSGTVAAPQVDQSHAMIG